MTEEEQVQPSRKKKWLIRGVVVLIVLAVVAYFVVNSILNRVTRQAMLQLVVEASKQGVEVSQPSFEAVRLNGFLGATWSGMRAEVQREMKDKKKIGRLWIAKVGQIAIDWDLGGQTTLDAEEISFIGTERAADEEGVPEKRIEIESLSCGFPVELFSLKAAAKGLLTEFFQLWEDGTTGLPLEIEGKISFALKGKPVELRMDAQEFDGKAKLVFLRDDVARLSDIFEDKLTEAEIDLIASQARQAPRLLEIKDDAEVTSALASERDDTVPQDAYRHVLWSFILTNEFGAELAKRVGDAHEAGDTGNSPAERDMDLNNNAIGRKYADEGVTRSQLLGRLQADPKVIREP